jgi:hypothetical protein
LFATGNERLMSTMRYSIKKPETCPACGAAHLSPVGAGTQTLEAELEDRIPPGAGDPQGLGHHRRARPIN